MIHDVEVVTVPAQAVVALRARGPLADIGRRMRRLRELVAQASLTPAGPMMGRFYEDDVTSQTLEYDVCLPVQPGPGSGVPDRIGEARGEWVPQHPAVETVHRGPLDDMEEAAQALFEALDALGYARSGPLTEVYEVGRSSGAAPADYVTRVRLPYAR
jgi:effector-binding domain-containing protein